MDGKIRFKRVLSCFLSAVLLLTGSAWLVLAEQGQPSEYTSEAARGEQPDETAASSVDGTIASSGEINAAPSGEDAAVELAAQCGISSAQLQEMLRILLREEGTHERD